MLEFASLGSGSKGNGTLIKTKTTTLLLDCGFSLVETKARLASLGCDPQSIQAILVTHEHADHIQGVGKLSRKYDIPVYLTQGTYNTVRDSKFSHHHKINPQKAFTLGDIHIQPYPVPHDAREACQYVFSHNNKRLGILTDAGSITPHMVETLNGVDVLLLECNYDADMLRQGNYPYALKKRVAGQYGHLDNQQSRQLLQQMDTSKLQLVIGMHLSETNNRPEYVRKILLEGLCDKGERVMLATQSKGFTWKKIK